MPTPDRTDVQMLRRMKSTYVAFSLIVCTGCTGTIGSNVARVTATGRLLQDGAPAGLTKAAIEEARQDSVPLLYAFAIEAKQIGPNYNDPNWLPASNIVDQQRELLISDIDWKKVTLVGEGYIDAQCAKFLSALDELERSKRGTLANMNALQSAATGIMGLAEAAQKTMGVLGLSFGLLANLIDNTTAIVMYQLPANSIRAVVKAQRDALRNGEEQVLKPVDSQGMASSRLAEYAQYCTPITIEANISTVLARTEQKDGKIESSAGAPAITSNLVSPISGVPDGTRKNPIGSNQSAPVTGVVSQDILDRLATFRVFLAKDATDDMIKEMSTVLGIVDATADTNKLRIAIRTKANAIVTSGSPALAKLRMDGLSNSIKTITKKDF